MKAINLEEPSPPHSRRQSRRDLAGPLPFVSPRVYGRLVPQPGCLSIRTPSGARTKLSPSTDKELNPIKQTQAAQPNGQINRPSDYLSCLPGGASVASFP